MDYPDYMTQSWEDTTLPYEHGATRIIEDSMNPQGDRVTTFESILWRPMLAENNTHRANSKNAASNRAIPLRRPKEKTGTLDIVERFPAGPLKWGKEQPGMQSGGQLEGDALDAAMREWDEARKDAVRHAENLAAIGLHKSLVNRILEPFMWIKVVQTSTSLQNMFNQRATTRTEQAQAEMAAPVDQMEILLEIHTPKLLLPGEWHLPYVLATEKRDGDRAVLKRISAARCARTSYLTHDQKKDVETDLGLFVKLKEARPMHASPFEHVCTPLGPLDKPLGNLRGFRQFRHELEAEAGLDSMR